MVEFALVLPLIAILVCGAVDFGRYFAAWNEVKNAAREGALYAERHPLQQRRTASGACTYPNNIADKAMQERAENAGDASFTVTISPPVPGGCLTVTDPMAAPIKPGDTVTVTVSKRVELITPLMDRIVGDVDITASVRVTVQG